MSFRSGLPSMGSTWRPIVTIGSARGLIAIYFDEAEALDLAAKYPYPDGFGAEILAAVERAYPKEDT